MLNVEQLKQAKKAQKMTYQQLSESSGVPLSTIYDLFRGVTTAPRIDTVEAIEKALGLSDPVTPEERASGVVDTTTAHLTPKEDELMTLVRQAKEKYGEPIEDAIIAFVKNL